MPGVGARLAGVGAEGGTAQARCHLIEPSESEA